MILYYIKLARKGLSKHKYYTLINVFGLVTGMLSVFVIAKYIGASLQADNFHEQKEGIYSISQEEFIEGNSQGKRKTTYLGVADLALQFGEIRYLSTYYQRVESLVIADNAVTGERRSFTENKLFVADSTFFRIFTFPFVYGNKLTAFSPQNAIVITNATSQKYFGEANPVGETLTLRVSWGHEATYQITGVIEDIPKLSRFNFDFLIRQSGLNEAAYWDVPDYSIFILPEEGSKASHLAEKLNHALAQTPPLKSGDRRITVSLDSLAHPQLSIVEWLLVTIGIFIMLISWTNYINQVIARSYWRMKVIGIQRVMGASGGNIREQFIVESFLTCAICLVLVFAIYLGLERPLQFFTDGHLLPLVGDPTYINVAVVGVFVFGAILAAVVQALILLPANFGPSIQNVYTTKIGGMGLRKLLVVVQFSISTILIVSVFVVSGQLKYMRSGEKGFNMEAIVIINAPMVKDTTWNVKRKTLALFKARCAELPFVTGVTSSTSVPGEEYRQETYLSLDGSDAKAVIHQNGIDENFFSLYEVEFIAGRDFIPDAGAKNRSSIILNRSAARALGFSDFNEAIDAKIADHEGEEVQVFDLVGIVEDFHQTSMKYEVRPMAFKYNVFRGHCSVKVNMIGFKDSDLSNALHTIQNIWIDSYPTASFEPFFLTEKFTAQHRDDENFGSLVRYFTILAVIISCMGLFGLSLLISTKRQKEVGIRKIFGASSAHILRIFLKSYIAPLMISLAIGVPIAVWLMNAWLTNFAYRIDIGLDLIADAVGSLMAIFLLTVSYYTMKSAAANPIKVLRE